MTMPETGKSKKNTTMLWKKMRNRMKDGKGKEERKEETERN